MRLQVTLDFLAKLSRDNSKVWFDAHRADYTQARAAFEDLIAALIVALRATEDLGALTPKECMFRINRDVRFSHDKSPYHTQMTAAIGPGGRVGQGRSYFLQIAGGDSFVASGLFAPEPTELENLRQQLVLDAQPLRAIVADPVFINYFGTLRGETVKTAPKGYDRAHPAIDLLRYKQFLAIHRLSDQQLREVDIVEQIVAACAAMRPFLDYLVAASAPPS